MRGPARYAEPKPKGLLGILTARRSFVYAFEKQRLRFRKGGRRQRIGTWIAAVLYMVSAFYMACAILGDYDYADPILAVIAVALLFLMPIALVLGSPSAGTRAFAGERANGTIDALVMTPMGRYELVAGRFLAQLRPYFFLFTVFACSLAGMSLIAMADGSPDPEDFFVACAFFGVITFTYFSSLMLGAALGLYFSLRLESAAGALLAALGTFLAIGFVEWLGTVFGLTVLAALFVPFGLIGGGIIMLVLSFGIPLVYAVAHLFVASMLVSRSARRFDAWGRGKWG